MESSSVMGIIIFVFGILNIMLFFKIWGMTNDVSYLKKELCSIQRSTLSFQFNRRLFELKYSGKTEEAKKMLDENLGKEMFMSLSVDIPADKLQRKMDNVINKYEKYYNFLNCEMPNEIKNIDAAKTLQAYCILSSNK